MEIKTVIIDDEPLAIEVIQNYCSTLPEISVLKCFNNPVEALGFIHKNSVDLVFLDIQMPQLTGLEFIDTLAYKPMVIFTTAYPQYAVEGFELEAIDYLVKPISYKRFLKAFNKVNPVKEEFAPVPAPAVVQLPAEDNFVFVKAEYGSVKIFVSEITYIQGLKDYLKINLNNGKYVLTLSNFKGLMDKLPEKMFIRVHNSYIVNLSYVDSVQRNRIVIDTLRIPVSESYKKSFFERLGL
ncbi:LytR/AlgR family response regulator transcription factor [Flavobacterium psychrotrophum]|uniref:LytR/AlgR family response regulator transcription factor n=1 Tax=Flavobacterium psychrotrophum TaxID=2294119 RepID=UPI001F09842A|nr:LytTR family DNA-binding domain-containing protein [Flavobacterium psychrotrophum]